MHGLCTERGSAACWRPSLGLSWTIFSMLRVAAALHRLEKWLCSAVARRPICSCYDCGLPYNDPGFADLVVPNDIWAKIGPIGHEGGLLCPTCLVRAAERSGVQCHAEFRSGPFSSDWQGIETAPVDGRVVEVREPSGAWGKARVIGLRDPNECHEFQYVWAWEGLSGKAYPVKWRHCRK
jgi:hypothetical protein